jgi:hypothetical protein
MRIRSDLTPAANFSATGSALWPIAVCVPGTIGDDSGPRKLRHRQMRHPATPAVGKRRPGSGGGRSELAPPSKTIAMVPGPLPSHQSSSEYSTELTGDKSLQSQYESAPRCRLVPIQDAVAAKAQGNWPRKRLCEAYPAAFKAMGSKANGKEHLPEPISALLIWLGIVVYRRIFHVYR